MSETEKQEKVDSDAQQVAAVYAKSLIDVAAKSGDTASVVEELDSFVSNAFEKVSELKSLLISPRVAYDKKADLIDKAAKGGSKHLVNFLKVAAQKGRLEYLPAMAAEAKRLLSADQGRVTAEVTTAVAIDDATESEIKKRLAKILGKEVDVTINQDPEIMGGLIVRIGDTVYDGSLSSQLSSAQTQIMGSATNRLSQAMDKIVSDN